MPALTARVGVRAVLALGCLVVALGCGFFAVFHGALWQAFVMTGVLGVGSGITFAAIPGVIVQAIPDRETGSAMGFYQVVRFAGFCLGSALTATVLAAHVASSGPSAGQPTVGGYTTALWFSAVISVAAATLVWFLHSRSAHLAAAERPSAEDHRLPEQTEGDDLSS